MQITMLLTITVGLLYHSDRVIMRPIPCWARVVWISACTFHYWHQLCDRIPGMCCRGHFSISRPDIRSQPTVLAVGVASCAVL